jgi:hypothetical protein
MTYRLFNIHQFSAGTFVTAHGHILVHFHQPAVPTHADKCALITVNKTNINS